MFTPNEQYECEYLTVHYFGFQRFEYIHKSVEETSTARTENISRMLHEINSDVVKTCLNCVEIFGMIPMPLRDVLISINGAVQ